MRSRVIVKWRERLICYYEEFMEWLHSIKHSIIPNKRTRNNLSEEYHIYERYAGEPFMRDFLDERTRKAVTNRYSIRIGSGPCDEEKTQHKDGTITVGKVRLMRNRTLIDEATLVIKNEENKLIYWKFN